ncbi:ABC transporter substrate-binding protein [Azospirillum halopraeferens]|uniref:ABC transporter substrate-binding protein n=1 Tax=Azospirillum halopraeferens TaxID=34010 RepID=UPI0003F60CB1|nr:ABC transporter substrate-binding protein [Azospirillum halopraeferens]
MRQYRRAAAPVLLPALVMALAATLAPGAAGAAPGSGAGTLVYCSEGNPESLNPQAVTTSTGMDAVIPLYDTLVAFRPGTTEIVPALAESWTVSPDGRVYTFALRRGVPFHDMEGFTPTRPLTAADVVFSVERQWKPDHPFHRVSGTDYPFFTDMGLPTLLERVEAPDDHTVRFTLKEPEAPFLANLAMPFMAVLSAEYAAALAARGTPERIDLAPVGTGPFRFVAFQPDAAVRYRAFEKHWQGRPRLDSLAFAITPNAAVRYNKLRAGECHVMAAPGPSDLDRIRTDPDLRLLRQEGMNVSYLAFNTARAPFDDRRVRRALAMAVDRRTLVDAVYRGAGQPARNPIPPTLWAYDDEAQDLPYDPAAARRLLAEAGHADGLAIELWYMPVTRPYMPNAKRVAEMIRADLETVGVTADLKTAEWNAYRHALSMGEHQAGILGWSGDNGDPDNFLHALLSCAAARPGGGNMARWCHTGFNDLIERARRTADPAERTRLYRDAQRLFRDELPWMPIAHSVVFTALRREVEGYVMNPFGLHVFKDVGLTPDP